MYFILNIPDGALGIYDVLGFTFENAEAVIRDMCESTVLFANVGVETPNLGFFSLARCIYQIKSFFILHGNVPTADAISWMNSLPDNDQLRKYSITVSNEHTVHDQGTTVRTRTRSTSIPFVFLQ